MGGSRRGDTHSPANLLLLCGSGTSGCHGWVESHRDQALEQGLLVRQHDDPAAIPVLLRGHWVLLGHDGSVLPALDTEVHRVHSHPVLTT